MNFSKASSNKHCRMITLSTAGSFFISDTHKTLSTQRDESCDLIDINESFSCCIENDLFIKILELYFRLNSKTQKINEMCSEMIIKQSKLQQLQNLIKNKEKETIKDEATKSLELLVAVKEEAEIEINLNTLEEKINKLENKTKKVKLGLRVFSENLINTQRYKVDSGKMLNKLARTELNKKKKASKLILLKEKKEKLLKEFIGNKEKAAEFIVKYEDTPERKGRILKLKKSINESAECIKVSEARNLIIKSEIFVQEKLNFQLADDKKGFESLLSEKTHQILSRKQWLADYSSKVNSKHALNRLIESSIESTSKTTKHKQKCLKNCLFELDQMEAKLETTERNQLSTEKALKDDLSSLLKSLKQKSVSFK